MENRTYNIEIDPRILKLLGPNLYTNIYYVSAELIANSYDADVHTVNIITELTANLQTFPMSYRFFEDEESVSLPKASRYIGNAVPPKLGEVIAESILNHLYNN